MVFQDSIWQIESVSGPEVILQEYMEHYWQGLTAPLPFFQRTSYAYALKRHNGKSEHEALAAAQGKWYGQPPYRIGECQDLYIKRCFDTIEALPPAFEETAVKIFQPLLASTQRL
jgi:exodeoxyribonuclease V gamma subunit